ncbi:hypothetical protein GCM10010174_44220 [Kutzneria viridogrisea]
MTVPEWLEEAPGLWLTGKFCEYPDGGEGPVWAGEAAAQANPHRGLGGGLSGTPC